MNYSISGVGGRSGDGRHPGMPSRKKGPKKPGQGQQRVPVKFGDVSGEATALARQIENIEWDLRDNVHEWILLATFKLNSPELKRTLPKLDAKRLFLFLMVAGEAYGEVYRNDTFIVRDLPRGEVQKLAQALCEVKVHTSGRPFTPDEKKRFAQHQSTIAGLLFGPTMTHLWECTLRDTGIGGFRCMVALNADTGVTAVMVKWYD